MQEGIKQFLIIGASLFLAAVGAILLLEPVFRNGEAPLREQPQLAHRLQSKETQSTDSRLQSASSRPASPDEVEAPPSEETENETKFPFDFSHALSKIENADNPEERKELLMLAATNCEEASQVAELARLGAELLKPSDLADVGAALGEGSAGMGSSIAATAALEALPIGAARSRLLAAYFENVSGDMEIRDSISLMKELEFKEDFVGLNSIDRKAIAGVFSSNELKELAQKFADDENPAGEVFAQSLAWKVSEGELPLSELETLPPELATAAQEKAITFMLGKQSKPEIAETLNGLSELALSPENISSLSDAVRHRLGSKAAFDVLQNLDSREHAEIGIRNVVSISFHVEPQRTSKWIGELEPGYFRDIAISTMVKKLNPQREAAEIRAWTDAMQDKSLLTRSTK